MDYLAQFIEKNLLMILIFSCCSSCSYGAIFEEQQPLKMGNFVLPTSQQPGPLTSLGQNIVDKDQTLLFLFADDYGGIGKHQVDIMPGILHGITDTLSVFFNVPVAASFKQDQNRSSGLEDAFLQFEYAFYTKKTSTLFDQATFVTNVTFPTGSSSKIPPTGFSSPSFFLGGTFSRMYTDWFVFTSHGACISHNAQYYKVWKGVSLSIWFWKKPL